MRKPCEAHHRPHGQGHDREGRRWRPGTAIRPGRGPPWRPRHHPVANLKMMVLPSLALGLGQAAIVMRQVHSAMVDVLHREYVATARAKGLSEWVVVRRHALKNALIPVITILGLQVGRVFGTAVVIETMFSLPGLARLAVDSAAFRDYSALQGAIFVFALTVLVVNLLTDCLYGTLDPRIRYQ
jgi:peptide/nickel transport system permease protein